MEIYSTFRIERINIIKISILCHMIYKVNAISVAVATTFSTHLAEINVNFIWKQTHTHKQMQKPT
jgi:hypothetical protein